MNSLELYCSFLTLPLIAAFPVQLNFYWLSVLESLTIKYLSVVQKVSIRYNENCNSLHSFNMLQIIKDFLTIVICFFSQMAECLYLQFVEKLNNQFSIRSNFRLHPIIFLKWQCINGFMTLKVWGWQIWHIIRAKNYSFKKKKVFSERMRKLPSLQLVHSWAEFVHIYINVSTTCTIFVYTF